MRSAAGGVRTGCGAGRRHGGEIRARTARSCVRPVVAIDVILHCSGALTLVDDPRASDLFPEILAFLQCVWNVSIAAPRAVRHNDRHKNATESARLELKSDATSPLGDDPQIG